MNVYDVEVVVEHRFVIKSTGDNEVDAANKGLQWVMDNEVKLAPEELDAHVEGVTIAGGK